MKSRNLILFMLLMVSSSIFAQEKINNIELSIGNSKDFFENVYVKDLESQQIKILKDGFYILENSFQKGKFEIKNELINGDIVLYEGESYRKEYVIQNSKIITLKIYHNDLLETDAFRANYKLNFKSYNDQNRLTNEGFVSLNRQAHYKKGITKSYYKSGVLASVENSILGINTRYYESGNKMEVYGKSYEKYNEDGTLETKQYRKEGVFYIENYYKGKLSSKQYETKDKEEITLVYDHDKFIRKEVIKNIDGEKYLYKYSPNGEFIEKEKYYAPGKVISP
ncbi:MAG: hypothetical protein ACRC8Z_02775 [Empedobacter falsenii]